MGIDVGFDLVPRLMDSTTHKRDWDAFIETIKRRFENDDLVEIRGNDILFKAGEQPQLPFEGYSSHAGEVYKYLDAVTKWAKTKFGDRIHYWNDAVNSGFYAWPEVLESIESHRCPGKKVHYDIAPINEDHISNICGMPLFSIKSIPGKGKGLVARLNIPKGHPIIAEKPLFTTTSTFPNTLTEITLASKLKALSKTEQRQFLSLHNHCPGKHPFIGIVKTNALPCGPGADIGGVYPAISRINHSCLPNTHHSWNINLECETIHAIRDIQAGEEFTISYAGGDSYLKRHMFFSQNFGFDCDCSVCVPHSVDDLRDSDVRRESIQVLNERIGDGNRVLSKPDDCLRDCFRVYQLLKEEYQDYAIALFGSMHYDAFRICITHGDQARVSGFARKGYEARVQCEGEIDPETRRMKGFMENPNQHGNFGVSNRWTSRKSMVPKGLNDEEFEKWLWRASK
ncbi:hypothetical protein B0J14DRAFT_629067 [Halenospora varia]|nr:hypothetical protein B0J14DRAFT_629067 [Halenospora varia]